MSTYSRINLLDYPDFDRADQREQWIWNTQLACEAIGIPEGYLLDNPTRIDR